MSTTETSTSMLSRWRASDRSGWRNFAVAMLALSVALSLALFSAAVAQQGRMFLAAVTAAFSLALAGWVAITIVPALARRSSLKWIAYQVDYRLTRDGIIYLGAVFILVLASVNTGNNLLFMILGCCLAGILISGVLSRVVLTGVDLKFDLPERIFAEQPVLAEIELRNQKQWWPSFSLRVIGENKSGQPHVLTQPVFFPYIPSQGAMVQKVELRFPRRGAYRQDAFGIRTRFPFGFFEKTRQVSSAIDIVVYPRVEPTGQVYEVLPLLSGEMASYFRGRGHELHSLRQYQITDSARFVDWKVSARSGRLMVREYAREDERRVMLVLDPFIGPPPADTGPSAEAQHADRFERAVSMVACIAWHFHEIDSVLQFRTNRFATPMATASEVIYDSLREMALLQPDMATTGGAFLDELASETEVFKIILTARPQHTIPTALWSSSYFLFFNSL
ncbi:MAG TPA: DUF58 domain-containing protein [Candidatus Acidoferrales bacterium]|jgi:uncharacterized protein (DUF58 family)|nr:DUF58 domain-containing protein [Candidatus Acidoferrales bacterium]